MIKPSTDTEPAAENRDKIILDLCGGTGSWSKPYKEAGYDVRLITLPEYDVCTYAPPFENVYGILAATPCDEFSIAKHFHGKWKLIRIISKSGRGGVLCVLQDYTYVPAQVLGDRKSGKRTAEALAR